MLSMNDINGGTYKVVLDYKNKLNIILKTFYEKNLHPGAGPAT